MREEILADMRTAEADREFFEIRSELAELVFDESESLAPAAEATGLEVKSSDWLDADTIAEAGPVLSNPAILAAMNDPEVREAGNNSELIEVGERHVVALRVTESEGERPKALEDVRERVVDEIRSERAGERLDALADEVLAAFEEGVEPAVAVERADIDDGALAETIDDEALERGSDRFDAGTVTAIFALPRPEEDAPRTARATLADGDRAGLRAARRRRAGRGGGRGRRGGAGSGAHRCRRRRPATRQRRVRGAARQPARRADVDREL